MVGLDYFRLTGKFERDLTDSISFSMHFDLQSPPISSIMCCFHHRTSVRHCVNYVHCDVDAVMWLNLIA